MLVKLTLFENRILVKHLVRNVCTYMPPNKTQATLYFAIHGVAWMAIFQNYLHSRQLTFTESYLTRQRASRPNCPGVMSFMGQHLKRKIPGLYILLERVLILRRVPVVWSGKRFQRVIKGLYLKRTPSFGKNPLIPAISP